IVAARGDRCTPRPACSTPPAGAGSARSARAAGSGLASPADLGGSHRSRTIEPSGTIPCGDASCATCAPGTRPCRPRLCLVALVGFQGHGCADVVRLNCCHPTLLEYLIFPTL